MPRRTPALPWLKASLQQVEDFRRLYDQIDGTKTLVQAGVDAGVPQPGAFLDRFEPKVGGKGSLVRRMRGNEAAGRTLRGDHFFEHVQQVLKLMEVAVAAPQVGPRGLTVEATDAIVHFLLPRLLEESGFLRADDYRDVELRVVERELLDIIRNVERKKVKFGLGPPHHVPRTLKKFDIRAPTPRALIYAKEHDFKTWDKSSPLELDALAHETVFVQPDDAVLFFHSHQYLPEPNRRTGGRRIVLPSVDHMYSWCKSDLGVAIGYLGLLRPGDAEVLKEVSLGHIEELPHAQACLFVDAKWEKTYNDLDKAFIAALLRGSAHV